MEDTEKLVVRMKVDCLWKEKADGGIPFFFVFFSLFSFSLSYNFASFFLSSSFVKGIPYQMFLLTF